MTTRVSIYSNGGVKLTEIEVDFKRTWKISDYGAGSFNIAITDTNAIMEYLQFGNFVYAEHDKLPAWGGMISTPREWGNHQIKVNCYSGEVILTDRITSREDIYTGSPGDIFTRLVTEDNQMGVVLIKPGDIYGGSGSIEATYHFASLYDSIKTHCITYETEFALLPKIDNSGKLYFQADHYKKMGTEHQFTLYENQHLELGGTPLFEQGTICNAVVAFGGGSTYLTIIAGRYQDEASIAKYGYRRKSFNTTGSSYAIAAHGQAKLAEMKEPRTTFDFNVADVGDAWLYLRPGNILPAEFYTVGFTGNALGKKTKIRIKGMTFNDLSGKVNVIADEVV